MSTPPLPHDQRKRDYDVSMFDPMSDETDIRTARSRYNARRTESSLVAWICSPEWTKVSSNPSGMRGMRVYSGVGYTVGRADVMSGEINAYTRDHVDAFTTGEGL